MKEKEIFLYFVLLISLACSSSNHWAIENKLHWILDVVFGEDASRKRKGNSASNFNVIVKMALSLMEDCKVKLPRTQKRNRAAFDPDFREQLLKI